MSTGSPTPSLESFSGTPIGSLADSDNGRSLENSPPVSTTSSVIGHSGPVNTICPACSETYSFPRVLNCLHVVCLGCSERLCQNDCIICPTCQRQTDRLPTQLLPDYALQRLLESHLEDPASCTACKSRDIAAVARCIDCMKLLCSNCVMAHAYMHCFETHRVASLADIAQRDERPVLCLKHKNQPVQMMCLSCNVPVCNDCLILDHPASIHQTQDLIEATRPQLEAFNQMLEASRARAQDLRACIKSVENTSSRLSNQFEKAKQDLVDCYNVYLQALNDRKAELDQELHIMHDHKQVALSRVAAKAQDTVDSILSTCEFVDKLRRYSNTTETLMHRKHIEQRLAEQMTKQLDVGLQNVSELEFVANPNAQSQSFKVGFGYIRTAPENAVGQTKMGPIARPTTSVSTMNSLNSCLNGLSGLSLSNNIGNMSNASLNAQNQLSAIATQLGSLQQQQQQHQVQHQVSMQSGGSGSLNSSLATLAALSGNGLGASLGTGSMDRALATAQISNYLTKRYSSSNFSTNGGMQIQDLNLNSGTYEKWSSGDAYNHDSTLSQMTSLPVATADTTLDINKYVSLGSFPPRSQIKRQKMIYHCKFGEFGVLEGQFTEPSGVAVNAQNDIIVADTNNHRIQIFDKEGRFKFQFGECGKRDGQLLYPNRVAVVRTSGDIIVTERSPTHQIQIYNQYGQFVRKFGANTLCYPRGVTVDNKGRIIVVECKVMRVIIFDQYGNVGHQFNCPNHLEFPNGVVVNDKQEIFISDNRAHCVKVFNYDGVYLRQIGGEGITNYPIGVGITTQGEILIADNHNNFNLTLFTQDGTLVSAYESKVKHAQCFDVALMDDGSVVLASKDYRLYVYRYLQVPPHI